MWALGLNWAIRFSDKLLYPLSHLDCSDTTDQSNSESTVFVCIPPEKEYVVHSDCYHRAVLLTLLEGL